MIDWLKYYPVKFRRIENPGSPKGPAFSSAKTVKCIMAGNILTFKAPRHRAISSVYKKNNHKNQDQFHFPARSFNSTAMPNQHWERRSFFSRYYAFFGPWFTGAQTQLHMSIKIINKTNHKKGISFFHPRAFEDAIADYLTSRYGHSITGGKLPWVAPVNWQHRSNLSVFSALFDVMPSETHSDDRNQTLMLPITERHILEVCLTHELLTHGSIEQRKKKIDAKPMEILADEIINSFTLQLTPEIQAQWDRVKKDCPDMSLTENFPPLKWPMELAEEKLTKAPRLKQQTPGFLE